MTVLQIRVMGDPVLREKARPVERFDRSLQRLASDMIETMYEAHGVGLAAPQVGVSLRLFVFDDGETGPQAIANPELSGFDGEQDGEEGCLSIPGIYFPVLRANNVKVRGLNMKGKPVEFDADELLARIMQHETDHVDGILFIDRLSDEDRRQAMKQIRDQELGLIGTEVDSSAAL
jgi:peptide deformylase